MMLIRRLFVPGSLARVRLKYDTTDCNSQQLVSVLENQRRQKSGQTNFHFRVEVLVGHDKGKIGTIFKMFKERNVVYVQGLNKKVDPNTQILNFTEAPLFVTHEVKLVDPSDMKQTDIEWRFIENGERVRVSKRTGRLIPIPASARNTWEDGIDSTAYKNSKKDMDLDELKKVTFKPVNSTFEEAILKEHGLYEPQKKRKTYWY